MAYTRGTSANIIVGAAALFAFEDGEMAYSDLPKAQTNVSYKETLTADAANFRNVGYTSNGLELTFAPDFGEVSVDQVLDVAKLYKQGMTVNLNTSFAEATLENLLLALARPSTDAFVSGGKVTGESSATREAGNGLANEDTLNLSAGELGECPIERGLVAVGPGTGDCAVGSSIERIYVAYRAISIDSVTVSAKRDEATMFDVSFRLLPTDSATYGRIVDRTLATGFKGGFPSDSTVSNSL
jgi:hypothetical protein